MVQQADLLQGDASASEKRKEKSPNALRTISEAADVLGVPQHVLRFWETKFPQITPLKRNGGRRFYRPEDIVVLQQVKFLLYQQGYTIKGARKAIEDFTKGEIPQLSQPATLEGATQPKAWYQSVPAANSNDNDNDNKPNPPAVPEGERVPNSPKAHVDAMRDELLQMRESLKKLLPTS